VLAFHQTDRPRQVEYALCLRLQRGCGVRGWGRDGLGTGARGRGARAWRPLMSTTRPPAWWAGWLPGRSGRAPV